jgi:hypothetical protein
VIEIEAIEALLCRNSRRVLMTSSPHDVISAEYSFQVSAAARREFGRTKAARSVGETFAYCRRSRHTLGQFFRACGAILYWMNRIDLSLDQRRAACLEALAILSDHKLGVSIGILMESYHANTIWAEGLSRLVS